jgi:hypothetical protein
MPRQFSYSHNKRRSNERQRCPQQQKQARGNMRLTVRGQFESSLRGHFRLTSRARCPTDIERLQQRIVTLEQQVVDLRLQLEERDYDLAAARAANRELMAQLNVSQPTG